MRLFNKIRRDEAGATAIEYGLIASLIAVGLATAVPALSENIGAAFTSAGSSMGGAAGEGGSEGEEEE